jgi:hypothetical protein
MQVSLIITENNMRKTLKKGSAEAKAFMAKLRAKKRTVKKTVKRVAKNAVKSFKDGYNGVGSIKPNLLMELWFAVHNKSTLLYDSISKKLDAEKVPFRIQNNVAMDAENMRYKKNIDTFEVKDRISKIMNKKIGSTLLIEKGENPRKKPTRVVQVNRTKKGTFKKFKSVSGVGMHTDTKSHNVNIDIVSGVGRKSGFIGRAIIKRFTLSELKKLNPIYFAKGNDKFFGVYKRKLMISQKLNTQVMIEASKNVFGGETVRRYTVRLIKPNGQIDSPKSFETLFGASDYIGKNIIL